VSEEVRDRAAPAILNAGALAGALDIAAACVQGWFQGRSPVRVLQSVASGWLGRESYMHGVASAALGFVTHFTIATCWAAGYWAASRVLRVLVRRAWICGALYGLLVYAVMYEVVIPLSAIHRHVQRTQQALIIGLLVHVFCVGLPIALTVRGHTSRRDTSTN